MTIDNVIYNLNLDYLMLAHELIHTGQKQQAMVCLGLTSDTVEMLYNLPIHQLKELARSDVLRFALRFPQGSLPIHLTNKSENQTYSEHQARQLRMIVSRQAIKS